MKMYEMLAAFIVEKIPNIISNYIKEGYIFNEPDFQCYIFKEVESFIEKENWDGFFVMFNNPSIGGIIPDLLIFSQHELVIAIELKFYFLKSISKKECVKDITKLVMLNKVLNNNGNDVDFKGIFIAVVNHESQKLFDLKKIINETRQKLEVSGDLPITSLISVEKTRLWKSNSNYLDKYRGRIKKIIKNKKSDSV